MPTTSQSPVRELRSYIAKAHARFQEMGWVRALLHISVFGDITADIEKRDAKIRDDAYANEQTALTMAQEIEAMFADRIIDEHEAKRLQQFPGGLKRCADRSHDIAEATA